MCGKEQPEGIEVGTNPEQAQGVPVPEVPKVKEVRVVAVKEEIPAGEAQQSQVSDPKQKKLPMKLLIGGAGLFLVLIVVMTLIAVWLMGK